MLCTNNIGNTEHDEHSPRPGVQHDGPGLLQASGHQHGGRQARQVRHRDGVRSCRVKSFRPYNCKCFIPHDFQAVSYIVPIVLSKIINSTNGCCYVFAILHIIVEESSATQLRMLNSHLTSNPDSVKTTNLVKCSPQLHL